VDKQVYLRSGGEARWKEKPESGGNMIGAKTSQNETFSRASRKKGKGRRNCCWKGRNKARVLWITSPGAEATRRRPSPKTNRSQPCGGGGGVKTNRTSNQPHVLGNVIPTEVGFGFAISKVGGGVGVKENGGMFRRGGGKGSRIRNCPPGSKKLRVGKIV